MEEKVICPVCGEENDVDDMVYHVWDIGEVEEMICPSCREDEDL